MNAIPPKGQMPGKKGPGQAADGVRLTMDFDDEDPALLAEADSSGHGYSENDEADTPEAGAGAPHPADDLRERPRASASARREPAAHIGGTIPPLLAGIEVTLTVEVGSLHLPLRDLISVEPGQLFALDRMTSEPVSILVNARPFACGEIVAVGDRFGVRVLEILAQPPGGQG
jgi:flagellar motor switch protein FliN/FliY